MDKKIGAIAFIVCAVAIIALIAALNMGKEVSALLPSQPVAEAQTSPAQDVEVEDADVPVGTEVSVAVPMKAYGRFSGLSYRYVEGMLIVSGSYVAGETVTMHCGDSIVGTSAAGSDGTFSVEGACQSGDDVFVSGADSVSEHVTLNIVKHRTSHGGGSRSVEPATHGVPEFSTWTLGFAIIGACLGLAYLRR
jgi:hypothetical protein